MKTFTPIVSDIIERPVRRHRRCRRQVPDRDRITARRTAKSCSTIRRRKTWKDVLPEKPEPLESSGTAGGKLFVTYLKDVTTRAYVYSLDGKLENEVKLPGLGTAGGFGGRNDDKFVFYSYTSFNSPPTIYKYDIATQKVDRVSHRRYSRLQCERLRGQAGLL